MDNLKEAARLVRVTQNIDLTTITYGYLYFFAGTYYS